MKKGFTIIELIICLGLSGVIAATMVSMLLKHNSDYVNNSRRQRNFLYSLEAFRFIQQVTDDAKSVKIISNTVELYYADSSLKNIIRLKDNDKLVVVYLKNNIAQTSNNILTEVESFTAIQKNNVVYLSIIRKNGEKYEKCISIKSA